MPLLDHFHPPLEKARHWESFHSFWTSAITQSLNHDWLPSQYVAEPHVTLGVFVEADVGAFEEHREGATNGRGIQTAVYAPAKAPVTFHVDWEDLDLFEVQIFQGEGENRLVAAIELVSPANKDRPGNREAFVRKCATYLQEGVSVVVVDVVTSRSANLHRDLLKKLGKDFTGETSIYAVAYRVIMHKGKTRLEAWPTDLKLGKKLPTLPLWLTPDLAVPLHLEPTYQATCESLRIPRAKR
jgi:hypothetical protein